MPDAAIPIFQTVNIKGEATLEVEAVIKALGLTFPELAAFLNKNSIYWTNSSPAPGANYEFMSGFTTGLNQRALSMGSVTGAHEAALLLESGNTADEIRAFVGAENKLLLDDVGQSSWLQLISLGKWRCNFGYVSSSFPGGTSSVFLAISHGLGVKPALVIAIQAFPNPGTWLTNMELEPNGTNWSNFIRTVDNSVPAAGTAFGMYWFAIG